MTLVLFSVTGSVNSSSPGCFLGDVDFEEPLGSLERLRSLPKFIVTLTNAIFSETSLGRVRQLT